MGESDFHRSIAKVFSNSVFETLLRKNDLLIYSNFIKRYHNFLEVSSSDLNLDILKRAYRILELDYRNEYIYKNSLLVKKLLGQYSLNTATLLNEFKAGIAKADSVLLNGTSTVYEIKTELDNPDRLSRQISEYQKVFKEVNVLTHHSVVSKYLSILPKSVGVLYLSKKFTLSTARQVTSTLAHFNHELVMKSLRKTEYSNIIIQYHGHLPQVPNTLYFKKCLELFKLIPAEVVHDLMLSELKKRKLNAPDALVSDKTPDILKHICFCLNLNNDEYKSLYKFLNMPACTYLT